ncbi:hypothetical protein EWM64_g7126 [Hericium alpestre]|uniref:Protein YOP1 n=1 Tax=Hericium alpestre TaxID=135208 RepID=A0A4Y9ZS56_9AGAM|nr:hypothetical protein EWM64_g7126 [Hericium alpestre]
MGLIVLTLRSYLVFQNIYQTFKTIKRPPPSARNNGQPSVRAMTQRKRDMKGCMSIWIVWCCLASYEAVVEGIISIFIPFYDEIKSIILVFFILSRARGAEPIYLHVVRPLVKPYVATLDSLLDMVHNLGDFAILVACIPLYPVIAWWRRHNPVDQPDQALTEMASDDGSSVYNGSPEMIDGDATLRPRRALVRPGLGRPPRSASDSVNDNGSRNTAESRRASDLASKFYVPRESSNGAPQIWHAPPAAQDEFDEDAQSTHSTAGTMVDDWRTYPAFPSAYPPTPLPASNGLPNSDLRPITNALQFSSIPEDRDIDGLPSPIEGDEQGFGGSLLPPREPPNPGSDGDMSDDISMTGVQHDTEYIISESDDYDDDDYIDEEDDFDVTMRTPPPVYHHLPIPVSHTLSNRSIATVATVASSASSGPTVLTTVGHTDSLVTRSSSSSRSRSNSEVSSKAGKKRSWPRSAVHARTPARAVRATTPHFARRPAPGLRSKSSSMQANLETESDVTMDDDTQEKVGGKREESSLDSKRRRVGTTPRPVKVAVKIVRPKAASVVRPAGAPRGARPTVEKPTAPRANARPVATRTHCALLTCDIFELHVVARKLHA